MFGRIGRGVSRCWWALVAGGRATRRSFLAGRKGDEPFFEPLTPVLVENGRADRYERELLRALKNEEVLNIAVTGGYGAGKSSVLKTFFEHHPAFDHIFVSLATFSKQRPAASEVITDGAPGDAAVTATATPPDTENSDLINRIEETIVQQLLYAVPAKDVPKTRLKRITQSSTLRIYWQTLRIAFIVTCALRLWAPKLKTLSNVSVEWFLQWLLLVPESLAVVGVLGGGVWALYVGLRMLSLFSIDGLTLKGGKLEATQHGSVLHKNIDEIIYCFERSDINVVVIEDLDRFDIQDIFFRLREINFIIQRSPQIRRPVHFIYAIRDEMFTVTDKTKFFDLIIPIIPVVNSENSREKLVELMKDRKVTGKPLSDGLKPKLIETVCYYIDEMRLIKNIVNEYDIYANLLSQDGLLLDPNKLFAMVAVRNLYPEAYADLLKRKGVIHTIIEGYPVWVHHETQKLTNDIVKLRERRAERELEVASDLIHLRAVVWYEIMHQGALNSANCLSLQDQSTLALVEFVTHEGFTKACRSVNVWPFFDMNNRYNSQKGNPVQPLTVLNELSYEKRAARLEISLEDIDTELSSLQKQITKLKTMPFREASHNGYGETFAAQLKDYKLIAFLLHRGFLDTDYSDYLGYFYEGSLTQSDKNLILALGRGEMPDVGTAISNPERVAGKLDLDSLDKGKGILMHLIGELARHRTEDAENRSAQLTVILKSGHQHMDRLAEAFDLMLLDADRNVFIKAMFRVDANLILQLLAYEKALTAREELVRTVLDTLTVDEAEQLQGRRGTFLKMINGLSDVSKLVPHMESGQMGWGWLKAKPARFSNISETTSPDDLKRLMEWGCIETSLGMLRLLCRTLDPDNVDEQVTYHRLCRLDAPSVDAIIKHSPSGFVEALLTQEGKLHESSESLKALLELLEDDEDEELLLKVFERSTGTVQSLQLLPQLLWLPALKSARLEHPGRAIWTFVNSVIFAPADAPERVDLGDAWKPIFHNYIELNATVLASQLWGISEADLRLQHFFINSEQVSNITLSTLFAHIVLTPSVVVGASPTMPSTRWPLFVNQGFIPYSSEIRELIAQNSPELEGTYIAKRWRDARVYLNLASMPVHLVTWLSRIAEASITETIKMWSGVSIEMFGLCEDSVVELAKACARANKEQTTFPADYLPVILHFLSNGNLSPADRQEMLIQALQMNCGWGDVATVLPLIGDEHGALLNKRRVSFSTSEDDRRLAEALRNRNFVGAVKPEAKRIVVYSKRNL
ncbi:hypothetical protein KC131_25570 [Pseudomonas sp. JQ170]|uniref:YobI family P-loop NTPase n=1 Tax=unclassified Pseudomonas TaxID=196821 RepID=UPI0026508C90|nr:MULTISPECIES: hypothetical protein [unclassified Pseudomonas]MDN7144018.1 hypothetical protein [Pseudomonas sp. JQ170]WRO74994.1 hypothetical protein U9R80_21195 [Pseudomonas sp. 170C]